MPTIKTYKQAAQGLAYALLVPQPTSPNETRPAGEATGIFTDSFAFQYFPSSLKVAKSTKYAEIEIPGGSHPIYQWICGGGRTVSFSAKFVRERILEQERGTTRTPERHTVSINAAVAGLNYYYYPLYTTGHSLRALPPLRLWLIIPNTNLGGNIARFPCFLSDFGYEITEWHGEGEPKIAEVDLEFTETIQSVNGGVRFVGRDRFSQAKADYRSINGRTPFDHTFHAF